MRQRARRPSTPDKPVSNPCALTAHRSPQCLSSRHRPLPLSDPSLDHVRSPLSALVPTPLLTMSDPSLNHVRPLHAQAPKQPRPPRRASPSWAPSVPSCPPSHTRFNRPSSRWLTRRRRRPAERSASGRGAWRPLFKNHESILSRNIPACFFLKFSQRAGACGAAEPYQI